MKNKVKVCGGCVGGTIGPQQVGSLRRVSGGTAYRETYNLKYAYKIFEYRYRTEIKNFDKVNFIIRSIITRFSSVS